MPVFVLVAFLAGIAALVHLDRGSHDASAQVVIVPADPAGSPRTLEPLTPRQRRQARRIVARDTRFTRIVAPHGYRHRKIVPWGVQDERPGRRREVFIGTYSQVVLETPKPMVVASWPLVDYPRGKRPDYRIRTLELTVRGLRSVTLHVDLKRRRLVGIAPDAADEVIYPPDYRPPPPSPH
jgi:hypothetical protein